MSGEGVWIQAGGTWGDEGEETDFGAAAPEGESLLERDLELRRIESVLGRVASGEGQRLVIEGPAGIGKSALMDFARHRALSLGMGVLAAEASEMAANVANGVAGRLLGGGASGPPDDQRPPLPGDQEPRAVAARFAQAVVELASERPVLVAVDDAHWADAGSLRSLTELQRHLAPIPVAMVLAARPQPVAERDALLATLLDDRKAILLRPPPLSGEAVGDLLGRRLGWTPGAELVAAVQHETGGNPYLIGAVGDAMHQAGPPPNGAPERWVQQVAARPVAPSIDRRLSELDEDARGLIEAAVTVGDVGSVADLAAVAGIDAANAADAAERLVVADLMHGTDGTEVAHPLVKAAIQAGIGAERREQLLRAAADRLASAGRLEEAAARMVSIPPRGDAAVVEALSEASALARGRGAPETAATLLRRALAEPPSPERAPPLRAALGKALLGTADAEAVPVLHAAFEEAADGPELGETATALALALVFQLRVPEATRALEAAATRLADLDPGLAEELEAQALHYASLDPTLRAHRRATLLAWGERRKSSGLAHRMRLAELAADAVGENRPAAEAQDLAERALAGGELLTRAPDAHLSTVLLLAYAGRPDLAAPQAQDAIAAARERGHVAMLSFALGVQGEVHSRAGDLVAAETSLRAALDLVSHRELGVPFMMRPLLEILLEQGDVEGAEAELRKAGLTGEVPDVLSRGAILYARGRVRAAQGALRQGLETLQLAGESLVRFGSDSPAAVPWRTAAAEVHLDLGEREAALELCGEEVELAERIGAPETLGPAVRMQGVALGGSDGLAALERAVELLAGSRARLEHARALIELGAALAASDSMDAARRALRQGAALADRLGARLLSRRATSELIGAGGRPRRAATRGAGALSPAERKVAILAGQGLTNRQIAETFVLATKTIESHLASTYRKLGISGRAELTPALAAVGEAESAAEADVEDHGPNG